MFNRILEAFEQFSTHQLAKKYNYNTIKKLERKLFIGYIDIKHFRVFIGLDKELLQEIATIFLDEENSDLDTLKDMLNEIINLIVGSAKVISEEKDNEVYQISTPRFLKFDKFDEDVDYIQIISMQESNIIIAMKDI